MPFDATPFTTADQVADPTALYRERREKAAALWERVPVERFDMNDYHCGTTACALGWLGLKGHDGWSVSPGRAAVRGTTGGRFGASQYFALTFDEAWGCFGSESEARAFHNVPADREITPSDVARTLLALPYTLPSAA